MTGSYHFWAKGLLTALALSLALTACGTAGIGENNRNVGIADILSSVPDPGMRARWQRAFDERRLPPLAEIPRPLEAVQVARAEPPVDTAPIERRRPNILSPGVEPFLANEPLRFYRGQATVLSVEHGRISVAVPDPETTLEIHYRLPSNRALVEESSLFLVTGQQIELEFFDQLSPRNSLWREIHLRNPGHQGGTIIFSLAQGSNEPYSRSFETLPLWLQQGEPEERFAPAIVHVGYAGQEFSLLPGETARAEDQWGPVEILLISSYFTHPELIEEAEGDPYYVSLIIYRP